jgi:hypothetical protein
MICQRAKPDWRIFHWWPQRAQRQVVSTVIIFANVLNAIELQLGQTDGFRMFC